MAKKPSLVLVTCLASLIIAATLGIDFNPKALAKFAAPDGGCWCTSYVANYYRLPSNYPNAYQWSNWLRKLGWKKDHIPHEGDIEVLQPQANNANKHYGHVGVVQTAIHTGNRQWQVTLRGAYQHIQPQFWDANCHNVSDWTSTLSTGRKSGISYFYKIGVST